ncbi:unnamed protein product [Cylindrotheca closterium]|uniref:Uncharacterized protein n=1 Tax=Cylindrotheca closterium TaxID=2856 RepID=A0AAD2GDQ5_9STRA|nr:unnamed protein product [Cylindrotheca closterium]
MRHLSSGSGSGSGSQDSHDSSDDHGNQRSYSSQNTYNMTFVACDLCYNGEYPPKPRKKLSSWPTVTCKGIYYDLQSLNKHANPTQCYSKANEYRASCCSEATTTSTRQSRSQSSFPHPKLSTVFGIFLIWFIAREYVKSRRRLRDGTDDYDDSSSVPPEEGADYKQMDSEEKGKNAPQKLMKLGSRPSSRRSGRRGKSRRDDYNDDDDSNASPILSIIQMLISTPKHKQRKTRPQRGRSRRRSRSRSSSRSRSRGRRSKSRPIVLAEPDPPQMQLV